VGLTDGGTISDAQTGTLTLSNIFGGDAGRYDVVVSNVYGSVTSAVATLTVSVSSTISDADWVSLGLGVRGVFNPQVLALSVSGTNLYAGGYFTNAGGVPATN